MTDDDGGNVNSDPGKGQAADGEPQPTVDPVVGSDYKDFLAYLPHHTYIYRPTRDVTWTKEGVNAALPWPNPAVVNGKPKKIPPNVIIDRNAPIRCMSWQPGEPEVMTNCAVVAGGRIVKKRCHTYNLYQPPTLKPVEGDASPWLDHVERIYPDDWGHIVDCLAFKVQHPGAKINHGLVLGGPPRIGKDAILVPVREAVGQWNVAEVSPEKVLGQWNDYQQSVICRISEAKDLGDFNRYNFYEATKVLIAAPPDTVLVNGKYRPLIYISNVTLAVITTNHRVGALYLPRDDLRHYVCWSESKFEDFDKDYFNDLFGWYENENGCAIVADFLMKRDLSRFNPKAPPKLTPAFWAMVDAEVAVETNELADLIDALGVKQENGEVERPKAVTVSMILSKASLGFSDWLRDRKNSRRIPHQFEQCGYVAFRNDADKRDGQWRIDDKRQVVYVQRELSNREAHDAIRALTAAAQKAAAEREKKTREGVADLDKAREEKAQHKSHGKTDDCHKSRDESDDTPF
jgi:hypothetical protein